MLNVDQAFRKLAELVRPVADTEETALIDALGRIAAKPVVAPVDLPPFDASAMDGYAVAATSLDVAGEQRFEVIDQSLAGRPARRAIANSRQAIRVYTGAVMPEGANAVVLQENVIRQGEAILTTAPIHVDQHVRHRGHDVLRGNTLCQRGTRFSHFHLAWFAACGIETVSVMRRIRVGVFSTGDELAMPGKTLGPGQIYDSNRFAIYSLLQEKAVEPVDLGCLPDDPAVVAKALGNAAQRVDLLVTSGGVSVGDADFVKQAVEDVGAIDFWRVAVKPGKPLAVGRIGNALFFGLPGNPVSAIVTYLLFVAPAIDGLGGGRISGPLTLPAVVRGEAKHSPGRREYMRGIMTMSGGRLVATPTGDQGSNRLATFADANCLIVINEDTGDLHNGDPVHVIPMSAEAAHLLAKPT